jgi:hypothetical protein
MADKQLDYLEEIGAEWNVSLEDPVNKESKDVESRFDKYLDCILVEWYNQGCMR